ncbi:winged helix-turn-helix transcriptional regulator [Aureivirga sp. CE67]|uniref:winged helix-turn-helix transcriptional regulator n=1 Tax=Aureivirga sp. CE67 TaxID=1788983 RepID=UPI0018CAC713|nr:winged helix-turn-helix transcriptional regulator [Aureivirga sp. CE67]
MKITIPQKDATNDQPLLALFDILGQNWSLRIIWSLKDGPCKFRELLYRCGTSSPTTLNKRIKELKNLHLLELSKDGYILTPLGLSLCTQLNLLKPWTKEWARKFPS